MYTICIIQLFNTSGDASLVLCFCCAPLTENTMALWEKDVTWWKKKKKKVWIWERVGNLKKKKRANIDPFIKAFEPNTKLIRTTDVCLTSDSSWFLFFLIGCQCFVPGVSVMTESEESIWTQANRTRHNTTHKIFFTLMTQKKNNDRTRWLITQITQYSIHQGTKKLKAFVMGLQWSLGDCFFLLLQ